jgi:hypothetical protein
MACGQRDGNPCRIVEDADCQVVALSPFFYWLYDQGGEG